MAGSVSCCGLGLPTSSQMMTQWGLPFKLGREDSFNGYLPQTLTTLKTCHRLNIDLPRHLYIVGIVGQIGFSFFEHRDKFISLKLYMKARRFCPRLAIYSTPLFWVTLWCSQRKGSGQNSMIKGPVFILGSCFPVISRNSWVAIAPRVWLKLNFLLESLSGELKARMCNIFLKDYS